MKWSILILLIVLSNSVLADEGSITIYERLQAIDLSVHLSNGTGDVTNANCKIQIRNSSKEVMLDDSMFEIGGGWYNYTFNTSQTGRYYCRQNCTQGELYSSGTCDFIIEGEFMSPEAMEIILIILAIVISTVLFILSLRFQDPNFALLAGFLFCLIGIYLYNFGFADLNNFISTGISFILVAVGCIILFRTSIEILDK